MFSPFWRAKIQSHILHTYVHTICVYTERLKEGRAKVSFDTEAYIYSVVTVRNTIENGDGRRSWALELKAYK